MRLRRSTLTDVVILHTPTGQQPIAPGQEVDFDARVGAHTVEALLGPRLAEKFVAVDLDPTLPSELEPRTLTGPIGPNVTPLEPASVDETPVSSEDDRHAKPAAAKKSQRASKE